MADYIDREKIFSIWRSMPAPASVTSLAAAISQTPAADVVEVRHGRWIHPVPGDGENHCSVCHAEQPWFYGYGYYEPDYCPNCGARMDKEDE